MHRHHSTSTFLLSLLILIITTLPIAPHVNATSQSAELYSPLNPLSSTEINRIRDVLQTKGYIKSNTRFQEITLKEPPKEAVWNWKPGVKLPRLASVILLQGKLVIESVVDLDKNQVTSWNEVKNVQGMILRDDWTIVQNAVMASDEFKKALKKRGITDTSKVIATPLTVGYFGPKDSSADPKERL